MGAIFISLLVLIPALIIASPFGSGSPRSGACTPNPEAEERARRLADTWKQNRKPGETSIEIEIKDPSDTDPRGLPIKRVYKFGLDDDD